MITAIKYRRMHDFDSEQLERLFLSVNWSSGAYPEKLVIAMRNFRTVFSAWDGDKLVGMICVMDDGAITAYVHYLLVDPDYQGSGIGRQLVEMVKSKYCDYLRIALISYNKEVGFYESCGFMASKDTTPMLITEMKD